ncbi:MAG: tRNA-dihydrouridine synthase [Candidatus Paceibacterota bacterium]|jgi:nifR3 family TIM-barrel protein
MKKKAVKAHMAPKKQSFWNKLWNKLGRPFFVLAPMANVTDLAFRSMIAKYGKPDVMWTEFVSADGLVSEGKVKLLIDLKFNKKERPIVAQLFTGHPEVMNKAAMIVQDLKFDGLDINMGCPDRSVEKQGGGAALMKNPQKAIEVLNAAREGAPKIPVSVKTRIGYNAIDMDWICTLLEQKLPVLTVHLRTRKEMSDVPAHWDLMPEIIKMRDSISPDTLIIGNGDVDSVEDGMNKCKETGCDGVMVGRGIFGKPWYFSSIKNHKKTIKSENLTEERSPEFRMKLLLEHAILFEKAFCGKKRLKSFDVMKKHFKAYVSGWDGAKEIRVELMNAENAGDVKVVIRRYLK